MKDNTHPKNIENNLPQDFSEAVKTKVYVHDKTQCDLVFDYNFFNKERFKGKKVKKVSFDIKAYFFIPQSMGGSREDISAREFHKNISNYQRINFPVSNLSFISDQIVIRSLETIFQKIKENSPLQDKQIEKCIQDLKLFSCSIEEQLSSLIDSIGNESITLKQMSLLGLLKNRIIFYRRRYVEEKEIVKNQALKQCIQFIDERLSFRLESILLSLLNSTLKKTETYEAPDPYIKEISQFLSEEYQYRSKNNYLILSPTSSQTEKEYYGYRQGIIKKFVQDILYIEHNVQNKEKLHRNTVAAIGAGMAATWAVIIEIQRFRIMSMQETSLNYIPLILIGVIAYIFKDRIKDLSKEFMFTKMSNFLPDYKVKMKYNFIDNEGIRQDIAFGNFTETIRIENIKKSERKIQKIREHNMLSMAEPSKREHLYSYKKNVTLFVDNKQILDSHLDSVRDIIRFDVSEFLSRLSNPKKTVKFYDGEKGFDITKMGKVYHLNIILKKTLKINGNTSLKIKENYERYRLVINKKGIMRLEKVSLPEELVHVE